MGEFTNAVALVTGAASGLGAAVCQALHAQGAQVIAVDIAPEAPPEVQAVVSRYCCVDVSDWQAWQGVHEVVTAMGGLKFLHLNAGIQSAPPEAPLSDYSFAGMDVQRYKRMMGVNVDGVVFGLQRLLPVMQAGGSIVITASLAGITPYPVDPLYTLSKHAVVGLTRSLAGECGERQLTINALCPGGIDTNIIPLAQRTGHPGFMTPEHVAGEVLTLMQTTESGKTWAKVAADKPAWIVRAPGDKTASAST